MSYLCEQQQRQQELKEPCLKHDQQQQDGTRTTGTTLLRVGLHATSPVLGGIHDDGSVCFVGGPVGTYRDAAAH